MKKFLLTIFCCLMAFVSVQAQSYVKVTSAPEDWSGDYLIVYEAGNVAFNGSLTSLDAASNNIPVTITDGVINVEVPKYTAGENVTIDENTSPKLFIASATKPCDLNTIPVTNFILCLPAIIAGKSITDCMLIYFNQTKKHFRI